MRHNARCLENPANFSSCGSCGAVDTRPPERSANAFEIQHIEGGLPDKARIYPGTGTIQVGAEWWASLNSVQRACVLAHERAHEEDARERCEECIDARAGAILRHEGFSRTAVVDGFNSTVQSRQSGKAAGQGWDQCDEAIRTGMVGKFDSFAGGGASGTFEQSDEDAVVVLDENGQQSVATQEQIDELTGKKKPPFMDTPEGRIVVALAVAVVAAVIVKLAFPRGAL